MTLERELILTKRRGNMPPLPGVGTMRPAGTSLLLSEQPAMGLFSKDIKNMDDLFVHTLRDIYYAEKQIVKSLPEMIDKASNAQLRAFKPTCAKARTTLNGWNRYST